MTTHHAADLTNRMLCRRSGRIAKFEYFVFVKALTAGLKLKQELPNCRKLRDADENASLIAY